MKTLQRRSDPLSHPEAQRRVLGAPLSQSIPLFHEKLTQSGLFPLKARGLQTLQINLGKVCNQVCEHCHVDAGPDRKESMTRETMEYCLSAIRSSPIQTVDLTGGAPEMNPHFRWFVEQVTTLNREVIVRCNLTVILSAARHRDLPQFFAKHRVRVVSSLPCYQKENTDRQRGTGVFDKSIEALKMLNAVGYGKPESGLKLDLVYNPVGAFLPGPQKALEVSYKRQLFENFGIQFNELLAITNIPVSRFLSFLLENGEFEHYLMKLVEAYNSDAVGEVMCRSLISVGWDGRLYDCDFNQMLEIPLSVVSQHHIKDFSEPALSARLISTNRHCFGCTAGAGSSCGGQTN